MSHHKPLLVSKFFSISKRISNYLALPILSQFLGMFANILMIKTFISAFNASIFADIILAKTLVELASSIFSTRADFMVSKNLAEDASSGLAKNLIITSVAALLGFLLLFSASIIIYDKLFILSFVLPLSLSIFTTKWDTLSNGLLQFGHKINTLNFINIVAPLLQITMLFFFPKSWYSSTSRTVLFLYFNLPIMCGLLLKVLAITNIMKFEFTKAKFQFSKQDLIDHGNFFLGNLTKSIYQKIDSLALAALAPKEALTVYFTLQRFALPLNSLGSILQTRFMATFIKEFYENRTNQSRQRIISIAKYLLPLLIVYILGMGLVTRFAFLNQHLGIPYYPGVTLAIMLLTIQASTDCFFWFLSPYTFYYVPHMPKYMNLLLLGLSVTSIYIFLSNPFFSSPLLSVAFAKLASYSIVFYLGIFILRPYMTNHSQSSLTSVVH